MWGIQCVEDTISKTKTKECHHQSCGFDLIKCSAEFWATYLWDKNEISFELPDAVLENSCARYKTCYKSMSVLWNISRCSYVWKHWNPCGEVYWTLCSGQVGYVVRARFMGCRFDIDTHLTKPAQLESIFISNSHLIIDYIQYIWNLVCL